MVRGLLVDTNSVFRQAQDWSDIEWLRGVTGLPIILKGILDPRDAKRAAQSGVDCVVVSNHGGREFDGVPASIAALPSVVDAVAGGCEVLVDRGIRSGADILRTAAKKLEVALFAAVGSACPCDERTIVAMLFCRTWHAAW